MNTHGDKIVAATNALEDLLRNRTPEYMEALDRKIQMYNDADRMISPPQYQQIFNTIETGRFLYRQYLDLVTNLYNKANEFKEQINVVFEKLDKLAKAVNNNKFKFGLKGQIKRSIERSIEVERKEKPEMTEEQQHAFEQPYAQTPADISGRGGRKTRRIRKTKKSKRRKTKKR